MITSLDTTAEIEFLLRKIEQIQKTLDKLENEKSILSDELNKFVYERAGVEI